MAMDATASGGVRMNAADNSFWLSTFEEHSSSVLAFLTSRVGRRDLAEDLLQETFVRVMRRGKKLTDTTRIRSYLFTTAIHLVFDQARRKRPSLFSEMSTGESAPFEEVVDGGAPSPEEVADLHWFEKRLDNVVQTLRPAHRAAFESAVLRQQPYAEVAREHGWTIEQVKTNVHRARKKVIAQLREHLRPETRMES